MEWEKALAELLLQEPEIRSWLGVDLPAEKISILRQRQTLRPGSIDGPPQSTFRAARRLIAS